MMPDKKDQQKGEENKEKSFTGSPEQQFPDLEAEGREERQDEKSKKKSSIGGAKRKLSKAFVSSGKWRLF